MPTGQLANEKRKPPKTDVPCPGALYQATSSKKTNEKPERSGGLGLPEGLGMRVRWAPAGVNPHHDESHNRRKRNGESIR